MGGIRVPGLDLYFGFRRIGPRPLPEPVRPFSGGRLDPHGGNGDRNPVRGFRTAQRHPRFPGCGLSLRRLHPVPDPGPHGQHLQHGIRCPDQPFHFRDPLEHQGRRLDTDHDFHGFRGAGQCRGHPTSPSAGLRQLGRPQQQHLLHRRSGLDDLHRSGRLARTVRPGRSQRHDGAPTGG